MYYHVKAGFYRHVSCNTIEKRNCKIVNAFLDPSVKKNKNSKTIGKCYRCRRWDFKSNFEQRRKRTHPECNKIHAQNSQKMEPFKTTTCAFTGQPFGTDSETKPHADHDHATLKYRAHIWAAANRLEGAANSIMIEAGWTIEQVAEALINYYHNYPGIDVGLQPYPVLGYATREEAEAAFNETIN